MAARRPGETVAGGGPTRLEHQPALDGLRGIAVAGVLLFHGGYLTGGYLGVDAFFLLSGYLSNPEVPASQRKQYNARLVEEMN